jgi:hypothetical protein
MKKIPSKPKKQRYNKLPNYIPCKPCWELKYCPYGPLVEFFPLFSNDPEYPTIWPNNRVMQYVSDGTHEYLKKCDPSILSCNVFGHVCPVFMMAEPFTETKASRLSGRYIPRDIMLKVVRRDNYICQMCSSHILDNEIEIDHIIPHSKGGPTAPENLRLLCRDCNREKSDSLAALLDSPTSEDVTESPDTKPNSSKQRKRDRNKSSAKVTDPFSPER